MARAGTILVDDEALCLDVGCRAPAWRVRWADVAEVAAWKQDVFAYDLLCVGLRPAGGAEYFTCDEAQTGWAALLHELEQRFDVKANDWWPEVVFPAFEENFTLLWRR